ncbi:hypothetical protein [Paenibacillus sp. FSL L8-0494]|uniref:hypothetical protein n=1 Tax=Paenibacillus sp. FSL L8-0494 TaxID=2975352 RepID=UPI0030F7F5D1
MTQTPQELTKPFRLLTDWIAEKEDYLSILIERMEYQKKWSEDEDPARAEYFKPQYLLTKKQVETLQHEIAECRHALQIHDREQQLKAFVEKLREENSAHDFYYGEIHEECNAILSTLYPDTPAPKEGE